MSLYLRTFLNKSISFVNRQKRVTKINRHLPKHVKSFVFLEEYLGMQTSANITANYGGRSLNSTIYPLGQNSPITCPYLMTKCLEILNEKHHLNQRQAVWSQKQSYKKEIHVQTLNVTNPNIAYEAVLNNNTQLPELYKDSNCFYKDKKSCLSYTEMLSVNRTSDDTAFNSKRKGILYNEVFPNVQNETEKQSPENRKASESQLQYVFECLSKDLPMLFVKSLDYSIYTFDLLFINNIRGVTTKGIVNYIKQIIFLKIIGHLKYAYVKLDILKITMHPEDSSIKVRWRITGISGTHAFLAFWKLKIWNVKQYANDNEAWYDGFSTFYVNNEGKIFKHIADKVMPDPDGYKKLKNPVGAKLAVLIALLGLDSS